MKTQTMHFARALPSDRDLVFKWANDPDVRRWSFNAAASIPHADHVKWFNEKLASPTSFIIIARAGVPAVPVGILRVDVKDGTGEISYSVAREARRRGHGTTIISSVMRLAMQFQIPVSMMVGHVKPGNIASQHCFERAGYRRDVADGNLLYSITIMPGTIIQARMGSTRFPGKVLHRVAGKPMLAHLIEHVRAARLSGTIVVATTSRPENDVIALWCDENGVCCYRGDGPEDDVLARYVNCAARYGMAHVIRLTADNPVIDPAVIDAVVSAYTDGRDIDYASNVHPRSFPKGMDVEVFSVRALRHAAARLGITPYDHEHVTSVFYNNPAEFETSNVEFSENASGLRVTVDVPSDLAAVEAIIARGLRSVRDIVSFLRGRGRSP